MSRQLRKIQAFLELPRHFRKCLISANAYDIHNNLAKKLGPPLCINEFFTLFHTNAFVEYLSTFSRHCTEINEEIESVIDV